MFDDDDDMELYEIECLREDLAMVLAEELEESDDLEYDDEMEI